MWRMLPSALLLFPTLVLAQPNTQPPPGSPHAFTAAPTPGLGPQMVNPADRAGGASDAGPMNSSPFSSADSSVLTGDQDVRSLTTSRPGRDPVATTGR